MAHSEPFKAYLQKLKKNLATGDATEHTHRPALKSFLEALGDGILATNEPKRIECGAPDYVITRNGVPIGYIEAKDIGTNLDDAEESEQLQRYRSSLNNLILTDYLEFRWYLNGQKREEAHVGTLGRNGQVKVHKDVIDAVGELIQAFYAQEVPILSRPKELAERMAALARMLRKIIEQTFNRESESGSLHAQIKAFRDTLIPDLKPTQFADMYAQTITYGLFTARTRVGNGQGFTREKAAWNLPRTNPFLRSLFNEVAGPDLDDRVAWLVDDIAYLLARADMAEILTDFGRRTRQEDPVVHFYETFLAEYDPKVRQVRGVYYTPEPVVSYIVRSADYLLKTRFGRRMGFADTGTLVLDPAVGTATFLYFVIRLIHETLVQKGQAGAWNDYVDNHLLPRVFGFELLMAPYAVAHMKLGILLQETGYDLSTDKRLGIYLTNSLGEAIELSDTLGFAGFITEEANAAAEIKSEKPIMVILGNPPYAKHSANKGGWMDGLLKGKLRDGTRVPSYYEVDGQPLGEHNPKWLQDDYVKFIRFGQWRIERTGEGILAFITNHGYLDNPTFRGMRQQLMRGFTDIYILDLHGNANIGEVAPDGSPDDNVFNIAQGVAISIFVKEANTTGPATVHHADLWGLRDDKYDHLLSASLETTKWKTLEPQAPFYLFIPIDLDLWSEYGQYWRVTEIFPIFTSTVTTARNHFAIAFDRQTLIDRIHNLRDRSLDDSVLRNRYGLRDVSYWTVAEARSEVYGLEDVEEVVVPYCYRPFDFRLVFYHKAICERLRFDVMRHMMQENIALLTHRPHSPGDFTFVYSTRMIGDQCVAANKSIGGGNSFQFPLYMYPPSGTHDDEQSRLLEFPAWSTGYAGRAPNLNPEFVGEICDRTGLEFTPDGSGDLRTTVGPEDLFHYVYGVLHSPGYRERYRHFLKLDFAAIPLISDPVLFRSLVDRGSQLVALHVMESGSLDNLLTTFPVEGSNRVDKVRYSEPKTAKGLVKSPGRVYINKSQYFEGVDPEVWTFEVGGYQILNKWLKERKGLSLSFDEILHYQRIVVALKETIRLMAEIDRIIEKHGGWPSAFNQST